MRPRISGLLSVLVHASLLCRMLLAVLHLRLRLNCLSQCQDAREEDLHEINALLTGVSILSSWLPIALLSSMLLNQFLYWLHDRWRFAMPWLVHDWEQVYYETSVVQLLLHLTGPYRSMGWGDAIGVTILLSDSAMSAFSVIKYGQLQAWLGQLSRGYTTSTLPPYLEHPRSAMQSCVEREDIIRMAQDAAHVAGSSWTMDHIWVYDSSDDSWKIYAWCMLTSHWCLKASCSGIMVSSSSSHAEPSA